MFLQRLQDQHADHAVTGKNVHNLEKYCFNARRRCHVKGRGNFVFARKLVLDIARICLNLDTVFMDSRYEYNLSKATSAVHINCHIC